MTHNQKYKLIKYSSLVMPEGFTTDMPSLSSTPIESITQAPNSDVLTIASNKKYNIGDVIEFNGKSYSTTSVTTGTEMGKPDFSYFISFSSK